VTQDRLSQIELIAMIAMLSAMTAFSIDAMLPALPQMADDLAPEDPSRVPLVIIAFVMGMGVGTLFTGPLSDAYGRRPIAFWGAALFTVAALWGSVAQDINELLTARFLQGLGAAGPRVVALAIVRDLYSGRQMAKILSLTLIIFTLVPALAPSIGAALMWGFGWRAIFVAFAIFAIIATGWLLMRQAETLRDPRPFTLTLIRTGLVEVFSHPRVVTAIAVLSLVFAILFGVLASVQPIFASYGHAESFHLWFGAASVVSASAGFLNAAIVERLGMRRVVLSVMVAQLGFSALFMTLTALGLGGVWLFFPWLVTLLFIAGLGIGNLNSMAVEPLGHMAGLAASTTTAAATVIGAALGAPIGMAFNGTAIPLAVGAFLASGAGAALMLRLDD